AKVCSPLIASKATFALNSAEYRFRFILLMVISLVSVRLPTLTHCPNFGDHLSLAIKALQAGESLNKFCIKVLKHSVSSRASKG
ncbi:MAG: hypothetical protein ABFS18_14700, partial [Thermodesulfobacteriota bacterium]